MRIGVYRVSDNFFITKYPVTGFNMAVFTANCLYERNLILDDDRFDVVAFLSNCHVHDGLVIDNLKFEVEDGD